MDMENRREELCSLSALITKYSDLLNGVFLSKKAKVSAPRSLGAASPDIESVEEDIQAYISNLMSWLRTNTGRWNHFHITQRIMKVFQLMCLRILYRPRQEDVRTLLSFISSKGVDECLVISAEGEVSPQHIRVIFTFCIQICMEALTMDVYESVHRDICCVFAHLLTYTDDMIGPKLVRCIHVGIKDSMARNMSKPNFKSTPDMDCIVRNVFLNGSDTTVIEPHTSVDDQQSPCDTEVSHTVDLRNQYEAKLAAADIILEARKTGDYSRAFAIISRCIPANEDPAPRSNEFLKIDNTVSTNLQSHLVFNTSFGTRKILDGAWMEELGSGDCLTNKNRSIPTVKVLRGISGSLHQSKSESKSNVALISNLLSTRGLRGLWNRHRQYELVDDLTDSIMETDNSLGWLISILSRVHGLEHDEDVYVYAVSRTLHRLAESSQADTKIPNMIMLFRTSHIPVQLAPVLAEQLAAKNIIRAKETRSLLHIWITLFAELLPKGSYKETKAWILSFKSAFSSNIGRIWDIFWSELGADENRIKPLFIECFKRILYDAADAHDLEATIDLTNMYIYMLNSSLDEVADSEGFWEFIQDLHGLLCKLTLFDRDSIDGLMKALDQSICPTQSAVMKQTWTSLVITNKSELSNMDRLLYEISDVIKPNNDVAIKTYLYILWGLLYNLDNRLVKSTGPWPGRFIYQCVLDSFYNYISSDVPGDKMKQVIPHILPHYWLLMPTPIALVWLPLLSICQEGALPVPIAIRDNAILASVEDISRCHEVINRYNDESRTWWEDNIINNPSAMDKGTSLITQTTYHSVLYQRHPQIVPFHLIHTVCGFAASIENEYGYYLHDKHCRTYLPPTCLLTEVKVKNIVTLAENLLEYLHNGSLTQTVLKKHNLYNHQLTIVDNKVKSTVGYVSVVKVINQMLKSGTYSMRLKIYKADSGTLGASFVKSPATEIAGIVGRINISMCIKHNHGTYILIYDVMNVLAKQFREGQISKKVWIGVYRGYNMLWNNYFMTYQESMEADPETVADYYQLGWFKPLIEGLMAMPDDAALGIVRCFSVDNMKVFKKETMTCRLEMDVDLSETLFDRQ